MVAESTFTLRYKVKVDDIDIDQLMNYHLLVTLSNKEISIGVIDSVSNRCLLGEKYESNESNTNDGLLNACKSIIDDHHLLKARFWKKVTVSYTGNNFTLVPNDLIEEGNEAKYLELHGKLNHLTESVICHVHKNLGISNIFSIPNSIVELFTELYDDKVNFVHQTSAFIDGVINAQDTISEKSVYINCEDNIITVVVLRNENLEYCNHFSITNNQDFAYYTLFVMNELYLNPETTSLTIWGELDVKSDAFLQLFKYIRNVKFGSRPKLLTFSYNFDEIEEHQLFSTLSSYYCG